MTDELTKIGGGLGNPFHPMYGAFKDNIRRDAALGDSDADNELRASMRAHGWLEHLPAIEDENGVILTGHRRLAVAEELNESGEMDIKPVIETRHFGSGDDADAERLLFAIIDNEGRAPLSPRDRRGIALYLYDLRQWSMTRIAEALNVSQSTVSRDVKEATESTSEPAPNITNSPVLEDKTAGHEFMHVNTPSNSLTKPAANSEAAEPPERESKRGRKGEGRPKGSNPEIVESRLVAAIDKAVMALSEYVATQDVVNPAKMDDPVNRARRVLESTWKHIHKLAREEG